MFKKESSRIREVPINGNMLKDIYERLGIGTDLEEEQRKFFNRLYLTLQVVSNTYPYNRTHRGLYNAVAYELGVDVRYSFESYFDSDYSDGFYYNLAVAETILIVFRRYASMKTACEVFKESLQGAFERSAVDLGITFENDIIIKTGVSELDNVAVLEPLDWLSKYPTTRGYFESALKYYLAKQYPDAMTNAYSALESLAKTVLGRERTLDNLIGELLSYLTLPTQWSSILGHFCHIAHEDSSRHGESEGNNGNDIDPKYAEAYIYFTGLMIRLIIRTKEDV